MVEKRIGILGGGQLGKMLYQAGSTKHLSMFIMENDDTCPAHIVCPNFTRGSITNFDEVVAFGKNMDVVTIEIENVNVEALEYLQANGVEVYPQPSVIKVIKDKGLQKMFYEGYKIPTAKYQLFENAEEIKQSIRDKTWSIPFVQKMRKDGYDGKGVQIIRSESEVENLYDQPSIVEQKIDVLAEISVIVARAKDGKIVAFPGVQMEFHPTANLVEYLFSPPDIPIEIQKETVEIALKVADKLGIVGLLAVEMFITKENEILVNEVAPRPHNSGHHTIEANYTSQYEQHLRCILGMPLGSTNAHHVAAMINLLGEDGYVGDTKYEGLEAILKEEGVYSHLYGKKTTKPFRKMGHITVIGKELNDVKKLAKDIYKKVKVIA
ncbi:MAG: 5-(carboxyamino)imidazole ribonucleotide synthase [Saprospiraceae bacterium]